MKKPQSSTQFLYAILILVAVWLVAPVIAGGGDQKLASQAWPMIDNGALLVDVRSKEEFNDGHLEGAINIEWNKTEELIAAIGDDKQRQVVFYCRSGNRAGRSIDELSKLGYSNIFNATGLDALKATRE